MRTQRSLALTQRGEVLHRPASWRGQGRTHPGVGDAAAADLEHDAVTGRLLERVSRAPGRPEDLLAMWRQEGETGTQGAYMRVLPRGLLLSNPKAGQGAIVGCGRRYGRGVDYPPAAAMLTDLLVGEGRFERSRTGHPVFGRRRDDRTRCRAAKSMHSCYREEAMQLRSAPPGRKAARRLLAELSTPSGSDRASLQPAALAPCGAGRRNWSGGPTKPSASRSLMSYKRSRSAVAVAGGESIWCCVNPLEPQPPGGGTEQRSRRREPATGARRSSRASRSGLRWWLHQRAVTMPRRRCWRYSPGPTVATASGRSLRPRDQKLAQTARCWTLRLAAGLRALKSWAMPSGALLTDRELRRIAQITRRCSGWKTTGSTAWRLARRWTSSSTSCPRGRLTMSACLLPAGRRIPGGTTSWRRPPSGLRRPWRDSSGSSQEAPAQVRAYQAAGCSMSWLQYGGGAESAVSTRCLGV